MCARLQSESDQDLKKCFKIIVSVSGGDEKAYEVATDFGLPVEVVSMRCVTFHCIVFEFNMKHREQCLI